MDAGEVDATETATNENEQEEAHDDKRTGCVLRIETTSRNGIGHAVILCRIHSSADHRKTLPAMATSLVRTVRVPAAPNEP